MIVQEVIDQLEELAPLAYAEDFDNVGLLVGHKSANVSGILVTLDTLPEVVEEAVAEHCNLIISFHPIIFKGLKSITGATYVERAVMKAIKHNISIFAIHTALDNAFEGVSGELCNQLGLGQTSILIPQSGTVKKLSTMVPKPHAESLRTALLNAGAGAIGNYDHCSFSQLGEGTFRGNERSNPVLGQKHELQQVEEIKINVVFAKHLKNSILKTLFDAHPYEEVAYEVLTLENNNQHIGMGMIGELETALDEEQFVNFVRRTLKCEGIRHSKFLGKSIKKVAVLGGSGSFGIGAAKAAGADAYLTADLKYHDFFSADNQILLMDVGHYESEQFTKTLLTTYLKKKIPNFAVLLSKINTNPVKYK